MQQSSIKGKQRNNPNPGINKGSKLWAREPICEVCRSEPACSFSLIPNGRKDFSARLSHSWKFTGMCTSDIEDWGSYIMFDQCFRSMPAFIDILAHVHEKPAMFNAEDFFSMLHRFREATKSYQQY